MKLKTDNGITLIALVITIIVLLILAGVSIATLTGENGILKKAGEAKKETELAKEQEESKINRYEEIIEQYTGKKWEYKEESDESEIIITNGIIELKVGDKVNYNEGTGNVSSVDTLFAMENLEWRVLGVNAQGQIELISTQPTTSKLTLSGEQDWLEAEDKIDTLCNDLYANGEGVTARGLKVEDIDKLAEITDEYRKEVNTSYATLWRYKYNEVEDRVNPAVSRDDGVTWDDYEEGTGYPRFKAPGEAAVNSENYKDADGNHIVKVYENLYYSYEISNKIKNITPDRISIASFITQGLNNEGTAASGTNITQWLSSTVNVCHNNGVNFRVRIVEGDKLYHFSMLYSYEGTDRTESYAVRPVVTLPSNIQIEKINGIWQIDL